MASWRTSLWRPEAIEMIHFSGLGSKIKVTEPLPALTSPTETHEEYDSDTIPETIRYPSRSTYVDSDDSDSSQDGIYQSTPIVDNRGNRDEADVERGLTEPWPLAETRNSVPPPSPPEPALRQWDRERPHRPWSRHASDVSVSPAIRRGSTTIRRNTAPGMGS
ncbi:uncharacterized protein MYCFIDRAFT_204775 [Pseudocercospora fijiensis CIRAD86]|uniref:Uncharacterized protein n=1 Tax=Pseudocercospora fijiensis (strain CIRAD86) TaxID=383855 RepID=M3A3X5_PSEFD|nr:uncharacterized protein MYCFIDRAFT_204775 [Pseudocercospora fijiensis CIRAD86]EME79311.1 hypothetical protein MYCFIDRAFT_204775 [Pseudocercospora fijiensis CIRAD86]